MWCPLCYRKLTREEFHPAHADAPAHWLCVDCDCQVNEWDDEFDEPDWLVDAQPESPG